jgi:DNA primase large subunit
MEEAEFALRYPFSPQAKTFIEDIELTENIVELGLERIKKALKGENTSRMVIHKAEKKEEIASFAAARMILGHLRNAFMTGKFAVNESKIVRSRLEKDDEHTVEIVAAFFGIEVKDEDGKFVLDLPTYVRYNPRSPAYRLINRRIARGSVEISAKERNRLIEEAVKKHIERIPLVKNPPQIVKKAGERLLEELPKHQPTIKVKSGDHPPCIAKLLESAKKHENLPHHARWFLATYLLAINMDEEGIVGLYSNMPDFNEKVTRYQIAHARKKGYSVPACSTVMGYGLCCASCRIGTPLRWHSISSERKEAIKR